MTPRFALRPRPDAAFEKLYEQHVGDVYRYSLAMLGNEADAEDVTQTTFMNAYRAFHSGDRPRKPAPWLRAIAHNVCRQRWRQAERRPREVVELDESFGAAVAPEEDEGPGAADISRALQALPFNQRSALVMRELEGRRQAEIAAELGLSESAVEALLFRARRAMREQLESSITCGEAARAISRQLDRSLSREERASLRAHLRECDECAAFARQARAQRGAVRSLGAIPVPASLLSWWSGSGSGAAGAAAAAGGPALGIGVKVAATVVAVAVVAGGGERVLNGGGTGQASGRDGQPAPPTAAVAGPATHREAVVIHHRRSGSARRSPAARRGARPGAGGRKGAPGKPGSRTGPTMPVALPGVDPPGLAVRAHGNPAHGLPAASSNGNGVRAHGTPPPSNGNATRAHGNPSHSNSTPTRAHGSPAQSNENGGGSGTKTHEQPPQSNGTPTRAHGDPPGKPDKPDKP